MNWRVKSALFKILSAIPFGSTCHQFLQERVTKSIIPIPERIRAKIDFTEKYVYWLLEHDRLDDFLKGTHVDLGAGWNPTVPLLFYSMGVERQWAFDVRPMLSQRLVAGTVKSFLQVVEDPASCIDVPLKRLPPPLGNRPWQAYMESLGIRYRAPYYDQVDSLRGKVTCVTSSEVLLYIPYDALRTCFAFLKEILQPGGLFIAYVLVADLYADADPSITKYNHCRYSPEEWERFNSPMMTFNRLKPSDYRTLLEEAGFIIHQFDVDEANESDLRELDSVPIHPWFQARYSRSDLGAKALLFVAEKPSTSC